MITINNINWIKYQGVLIPDEPPDKDVNLTKKQIKNLLRFSGAYFLRWPSNFDCNYETQYWYIIKDDACTIESLSQNTRHNVRRGLKRCIIKKVCADVIAEEGYESYKMAFDQYDTFIKPLSEEQFTNSILSKKNNLQWEYWGVWNSDNKMIAYSENKIFDDKCNYNTTKFHPDYLHLYPSDALFFMMNHHYLNERGFKYINDGQRSLSHKTNIQNYFIDKFRFRKAFCKLHIVYNWRIKILITLIYPLRKIIASIDNNIANKITVVLRYEEIRRSFEKK